MSAPQERNGAGLLQPPPCEKQAKTELNFKETELRLGLPGSDSPERKIAAGVSLFGRDLKDQSGGGSGFLLQSCPSTGFVSGGKRCFHDAINGNGSDVKTETNEALFAARREGTTNNGCLKSAEEKKKKENENGTTSPASKAQVVGWPPVRSFRKNNTLASNSSSKDCDKSKTGGLFVKVSMEGAPYLRKIDLKPYSSYAELSSALEKMFSCFTIIGQCGQQGLGGKEGLSESRLMDLLHGSEYVLTYEDKDGDWMLVGDVPWEMFTDSCKRLRIMKGSDAIGLAPRAMQKTKIQK